MGYVFLGVRGYVSLKFGVRFLWVCRYVGRLRRVRRYVSGFVSILIGYVRA